MFLRWFIFFCRLRVDNGESWLEAKLLIAYLSIIFQAPVLYYQLFTPMKLVTSASFIHHHHSFTATQLTFLSAPSNYYRLMKVPLIPSGIIQPGDLDLVVKMVVGTDKAIGQGESDPSFVISDGKHFAGLHIRDKNNFMSGSPCLIVEGTSGETIGNRRQGAELPKPSLSSYPGRFEVRLSLSDRWGSCFVPLDGGFSREMTYQNKLEPHKGLFLEIYGDDAQEKAGIKYIEVSILQETV